MTDTHVLIVDDDPDIRKLTMLALTRQPGFVIHEADCGTSALEVLQSMTPSFMVLDVMMPGLDGPGLFARMQLDPRLRTIPVVFLTAKVQRHEVQELKGLGAAGVLPKPFDPFTLGTQIDDLLRRSRA